MLDVSRALARAAGPAAAVGPAGAHASAEKLTEKVLVLGGGGALGSAVLEALVGARAFAQVGVLLQPQQPMRMALRGLQGLNWPQLPAFGARTALIVFDRERRANGRDDAFVRPQPSGLVADASALHAAGVQRLIVAMPYDSGRLPLALMQGLANLDEGAVASLGFSHLVFGRMAQRGVGDGGRSAPQRLAAWMLSQLRWFTPTREAPVRCASIARALAALAWQLRQAAPGTRVVAPQWWWHSAQSRAPDAVMRAWLSGEALPPTGRSPGQA